MVYSSYNNTLIIGVDTGNRQVKTVNFCFTSGLASHDIKPFTDKWLKYDGTYYSLSSERIPYMRDKSTDDRFFILSLFAIAAELEFAGIRECDSPRDIKLGLGIPPGHFASSDLLSAKMEKYYTRNDGLINFEYCGRNYSLRITSATICPQGYSAVIPYLETISLEPSTYVVDIGGFTTDVLLLKHGVPDLNVCHSFEFGIIPFCNRVEQQVLAAHSLTVTTDMIECVLRNIKHNVPKHVVDKIMKEKELYISDMLLRFREYKFTLPTSVTYFVGGGASLFKDELANSDFVGECNFITDIGANAIGYENIIHMSINSSQK